VCPRVRFLRQRYRRLDCDRVRRIACLVVASCHPRPDARSSVRKGYHFVHGLIAGSRTVADVVVVARLFLGGVFILAAVPKLADVSQFARVVSGYEIFRDSYGAVVAVLLPLVELAVGLLLITGIEVRVSSAAAAALLVLFALVVARAVRRGHAFDCGCGSGASRPIGWSVIVEDLAFAAMAVFIASAASASLAVWPISERDRGHGANAVAIAVICLALLVSRVLVLTYRETIRAIPEGFGGLE
jgi:putative oxidoreductase